VPEQQSCTSVRGWATALPLPLLELANWVSDRSQFFVYLAAFFLPLRSSQQVKSLHFLKPSFPSHPGAVCEPSGSPFFALAQIVTFHKRGFRESRRGSAAFRCLCRALAALSLSALFRSS